MAESEVWVYALTLGTPPGLSQRCSPCRVCRDSVYRAPDNRVISAAGLDRRHQWRQQTAGILGCVGAVDG